MSMLTTWGYFITDELLTTLPDIITETEFNTATGGRYTGDTRISPGITAASWALRNYCGWHLSGVYGCGISWNAANRGIVRRGSDLLIQLPARAVAEVNTVSINGEDPTDDWWYETNGLLRVFDNRLTSKRDYIEVAYSAGVTGDFASVIKDLCVQMVTLNLAKSYGVTSEAAGGVSITYNGSWTNGSFDSVIQNNAGLLAPYRLEGVF